MKLPISNVLTGLPVKNLSGKKSAEANQKLRGWNTWLAVLYALEGLAILFLSNGNAGSTPVVADYLTKDTLASEVAGQTVLAPAAHLLFNLNIAYIVAAFLFVAAVIRALAATRLRPHYEKDIKSGVNCLRWMEGGVAGGLMLVALGLASGMHNLTDLVMLFALIAAAFVAVATIVRADMLSAGKFSLPYRTLAGLVALLPFLVVLWHLIAANLFGSGSISPYVYAAFAVTLVLFALNAAAQGMQQAKHGAKVDRYHSEKLYLVLSFADKTLLAWLLFVGVLAG
ncbi:MAG TPA: heliorhodopsin HeR [Candidatus Saccharimonadales bacterium]|nr:heliorhodopsin HeR [Candidatus Saccharimonadales bacterium]